MNSRDKGKIAETFAKEYLESLGYKIIAMNYHSRYGEIDIIARDSEYVMFVEVKARKKNAMVGPSEAVTKSKQKKIIRTAVSYMLKNPTDLQPRFDVVEIEFEGDKINKGSINHIKNAFLVEDDYALF